MAVGYIDIPYKPSPLQLSIHQNLKRFNVVVLHRGAGKTYLCLNELLKSVLVCETNGLFLYIAPEKQQAKNIAWSDLKKLIDGVPGLKVREDELSVTVLRTGAMIRIEGADAPDRLRGLHPYGVVLDEVGQMKRDLWYEVIFPGIQRHTGWVVFIGTPKGDNLFKELYDKGTEFMEAGHDLWYTNYTDVYSSGVYPQAQIDMIKETMIQSKWEQEYLLSWSAVFNGSYYSDALSSREEMIGYVPHDPMLPVLTGWDFGLGDPTCVWFAQYKEGMYHFIDYYQSTDKDMHAHIRVIKSKPYTYGHHIVPHDVNQRNWETKNSRWDIMTRAGMKLVTAKKANSSDELIEAINVVLSNLKICRFDKAKCEQGLEGLMTYRAQENKVTGEIMNKPNHDSSDAADALRTFFMGVKKSHTQANEWTPFWNNNFKKELIQHEYNYFGG